MLRNFLYTTVLRVHNSTTRRSYCACNSLNRPKFRNRPNLTFNKFTKKFHLSARANAKLFVDNENNYMYATVTKSAPLEVFNITSPNTRISSAEEFNVLLDRNYREATAVEIVEAFQKVTPYCVENNITLEDGRFDKLVDGLMDHCEKLNDEEILALLNCLLVSPKCESFQSKNFHDVWSCLDDMCYWRSAQWDISKKIMFADIWYRLGLGKVGDFVYEVVDSLTKKAKHMNKNELLRMFFYMNVSRKCPVQFEYEEAISKHIKEYNSSELAIIALGFFKTQCKVKIPLILETMIRKIIEESKTMDDVSMASLLKIIRYSKPTKLCGEIHKMLDRLVDEVDRLSLLCCLHIALTGTTILAFHPKSLEAVTRRFVRGITDVDQVRLKDIERLLMVNSMFDFTPNTNPDLYRAAYDELHKESRVKEFVQYPRSLPYSLHHLSIKSIYSYELMSRVLNENYIVETYGKMLKQLPQQLLALDASIDIECPDYEGNRLPLNFKYKMTKFHIEYIPSHDQWKRASATDKFFLDVVDHLKELLEDDNLIYVSHVVPHFARADIIVCKDKTTGRFVEPKGFHNYVLGDVQFPFKDDNLDWYALIVVGWNNTIRGTSLPLGLTTMKERQLRKMGYNPVLVIWNQFMMLTSEQKKLYISSLLK